MFMYNLFKKLPKKCRDKKRQMGENKKKKCHTKCIKR